MEVSRIPFSDSFKAYVRRIPFRKLGKEPLEHLRQLALRDPRAETLHSHLGRNIALLVLGVLLLRSAA